MVYNSPVTSISHGGGIIPILRCRTNSKKSCKSGYIEGFHDALGDLLSWGSENQRPNYEEISKSKRAEAVREAFLHAYGAYEKYAMPADELLPLKNRSIQNFNGWGVSMFDALDTHWMG
ncbi:glycoside hydrolase family 47 [Pyrrhoderma noxium]|uniref:mannosyl-oligosaccharide 1,2-alpha-mannosidase n=1 Tax=Pyrrhoderma noxium TaxID=2282107 RepID=A0A286UI39_9AGAM|nr:glycoside hydrolase family 47 [Pyrrhoderma noxium]